jgi:hypothetical protein
VKLPPPSTSDVSPILSGAQLKQVAKASPFPIPFLRPRPEATRRLTSAWPSDARTQPAWRGSAPRAGEDAATRSKAERPSDISGHHQREGAKPKHWHVPGAAIRRGGEGRGCVSNRPYTAEIRTHPPVAATQNASHTAPPQSPVTAACADAKPPALARSGPDRSGWPGASAPRPAAPGRPRGGSDRTRSPVMTSVRERKPSSYWAEEAAAYTEGVCLHPARSRNLIFRGLGEGPTPLTKYRSHNAPPTPSKGSRPFHRRARRPGPVASTRAARLSAKRGPGGPSLQEPSRRDPPPPDAATRSKAERPSDISGHHQREGAKPKQLWLASSRNLMHPAQRAKSKHQRTQGDRRGEQGSSDHSSSFFCAPDPRPRAVWRVPGRATQGRSPRGGAAPRERARTPRREVCRVPPHGVGARGGGAFRNSYEPRLILFEPSVWVPGRKRRIT